MRLFLVRHGKAERDSPTGRDEDRALKSRGEQQSQWLAAAFARLPAEERPSLIISSPAVRARETARIIRQTLDCECSLAPELGLGAAPEDLIAIAMRQPSSAPLMLVGHNPTLEALLSNLVPSLDDASAEMRTGEAVLLETPGTSTMNAVWRLVGRWRLND